MRKAADNSLKDQSDANFAIYALVALGSKETSTAKGYFSSGNYYFGYSRAFQHKIYFKIGEADLKQEYQEGSLRACAAQF